MALQFACACGRSLCVPDDAAAQPARCPACHELVLVPRPGTRAKAFVIPVLPGGPPLAAVQAVLADPEPAAGSGPVPGVEGVVRPRPGTFAKPFTPGPLFPATSVPPAPVLRPPRRLLILPAAAILLLLIVGGSLVWRLWRGPRGTAGGEEVSGLAFPEDVRRPAKDSPVALQEKDDPPLEQIQRMAPGELAAFMEMKVALVQVQRAIDLEDLDTAARALDEARKARPDSPDVSRAAAELDAARKHQRERDELRRLRESKEQTRQRHQHIREELERLRAQKDEWRKQAGEMQKQLETLRRDLPADVAERARIIAEGKEGLQAFHKLVVKAQAGLKEQKYEAAVKDLHLALTLNPKDQAAVAMLDEARKGLAQHQAEARELIARGREALARDDFAAARQALLDAQRRTPGDPEIAKQLEVVQRRLMMQPQIQGLLDAGRQALDQGRPDDAANAYAKLARLVPDEPRYRGMLRDALDRERFRDGELLRDAAGQPLRLDFNLRLQEMQDRARGIRDEQDIALREQGDRMNDAARLQDKELREQADRLAEAKRLKDLDLREQQERLAEAARLHQKELLEQGERIARAGREGNLDLLEQGVRMAGAGRILDEGLREQRGRMAGVGRLLNKDLLEQGARIVDQRRLQGLGLLEQSQRMAGADRLADEGLREQGGRLLAAGRQQGKGLLEQRDRMADEGRLLDKALREQGDRAGAAAREQALGLREQGGRMAGAGRLQDEGLRAQGKQIADFARLQNKDLLEQAGRLARPDLREERARIAGAGRLQDEDLRARSARAQDAARGQDLARRDPDAWIKQPRLEPPRSDRPPVVDGAKQKARQALEDFTAKKKREADERRELEQLRAEQQQFDREEAEYQQLVRMRDELERRKAEVKHLQIEKARELSPGFLDKK